MEVKSDMLFEVSWEVCNKVGGIYTVVTSKAAPINEFYKEKYFLVGPYFKDKCHGIFEEEPAVGFFKKIFEELRGIGINCHIGKWLIESEPTTILIDYNSFTYKNNDIKAKLFEHFGIDSLGSDFYDYDTPMIWSTAVGKLIEEVKKANPDKKIAAQFHEWMSGGALLYLKSNDIKVGKIFTTHATMLGRTLAGNNIDLYNVIDKINPEDEAYRFKIQAKFQTERACANNADVFTTVSEITGIEATYFLGKKPDVLLPNGLDIEKFPTFEEASIKHKLIKAKYKEFLLYYFFPYYNFDLDNTLLFFLAGRYEYRTKGIDIYLESLSRLNSMMKENNSEKTVVAFVFVPAFAKSIKKAIIESKTYYEDIYDSLHDIHEDILQRAVYGVISKEKLDENFLLGENLWRETKKRVLRFAKDGLPPVCSHELTNENSNEILKGIRNNNLQNKEDDKVKVIYYPIYLTGADSLLDLNYYEAIMGCHFGIFPSYYEPWGYTPAETGGLGVASLTTDLAGFGRYIESKDKGKKNKGIFVLHRQDKNDNEVVGELADIMYTFTTYNKQDRIENKLKAKRIASMGDWKILINHYLKAHNLAIERLFS